MIIVIKKKFGFHNFAEHRLRTSALATVAKFLRIWILCVSPSNFTIDSSENSFQEIADTIPLDNARYTCHGIAVWAFTQR